MKRFGEETSLHGFSHILTTKGVFCKLCWLAAILGMLVIFCFFSHSALDEFLQKPINTKTVEMEEDFGEGGVTPTPDFLICSDPQSPIPNSYPEDLHPDSPGCPPIFQVIRHSNNTKEIYDGCEKKMVTWKGAGKKYWCYRLSLPNWLFNTSAYTLNVKKLKVRVFRFPGVLEQFYVSVFSKNISLLDRNTLISFPRVTGGDRVFVIFTKPIYRELLPTAQGGSCVNEIPKLENFDVYSRENCINQHKIQATLDAYPCSQRIYKNLPYQASITFPFHQNQSCANISNPSGFLDMARKYTCLPACKYWTQPYYFSQEIHRENSTDQWLEIAEDNSTPSRLIKKYFKQDTELPFCLIVMYFPDRSQYDLIKEQRSISFPSLVGGLGGFMGMTFGASFLSIIHVLYFAIQMIWKGRKEMNAVQNDVTSVSP